MKEIGSEFWDAPVNNCKNNVFSESTHWYLSGRIALQAIIKELIDCHSVAMPSWCCDSMIKPFIDAGYTIDFYPVYWDGDLIQEIGLKSDVLYLIDYFGYTGLDLTLRGYNGVVIRDVTHSFFSKKYTDADYYFGSLRKWCGVSTGGYAWARDGHKLAMEYSGDNDYSLLRERAMKLKAEYISEQRTDKSYLRIFDEAEEKLDNVGIVAAIDRDIKIAELLDVKMLLDRRRRNAEILRAAFSNLLLFPVMQSTDCPLFVPVLVSDGRRDELRRFLINNKIYCPIHWPVSEYHKLDDRAKFIYQNELSLVCDQRYTEEDMYRMVKTIKTFMEV